jgi:hypothetical protein
MTRLLPRGMLSRIELIAGDAINANDARPDLLQRSVLQLRGERL